MRHPTGPVCALLSLLLANSLPARGETQPVDPYPRAAAAYVAALDGGLLWQHRLHVRQAPASLTKLLTALVVLDAQWNPNTLLTVSRNATRAARPRIGIAAGDQIRAEDALAAMLMLSANDACLTLVEHVPGGIRVVADLMNERAAALGMRESHFAHPCGFDGAGQYSTAGDLLRLAKAAESDPRIAHIVALQHAIVSTGSGRTFTLKTTNLLLGRLDGVIGMKTGHTARAGDCLIALAERGGHRVWLVLLNAPDRWWTAHRIVTDAFHAVVQTGVGNGG